MGAIVGAWAGVVRIWAVRYSLQLIEGLPKPFVSAPESRPFAVDSAGRLLGYAGKIEIQCPQQTRGTAVILIAGQSNAANSGAQRHNTRHPDRVLNFAGGRCYIAASPLLGSNGFAGEYWTLLADQLIDAGTFDHVILAPLAVGGSKVEQWAKGGALNATMIPLVQDLTTRYRVTHVLWHQGEADFALKTDPALYKEYFLSFVESLRANGYRRSGFHLEGDPLLAGLVRTECNPHGPTGTRVHLSRGLRQGSTRTSSWTLRTDMTTVTSRTSGEVKTATAWAAILAQHP